MRCPSKFNITVITALLNLCWCLTGCRNSPKQHYSLQGRVLGKSERANEIIIKHNDIPGLMPAMTMVYPVRDTKGFEEVQPGDLINADLVVNGNNSYWLERLAVRDKTSRGLISSLPPHELLRGEQVPDLPFTNQDGKALRLGEFRGKAVLITFIYTRCPFPTFCPLISNEFAEIHKELAKTQGDFEKTHLISITLDPEYDTPSILRKYGLSYLDNDPTGFEHWDFVSTNPGDLRKLATAFGLEFLEQDNQISHSLETVLLSSDGTVSQSWLGNNWKTSEVISALRQAAAVNK
jgi:protein SCO1